MATTFLKMSTSKGVAALLDDSGNPFAHEAAASWVEIESPFGNRAAAPA